ncbi:MAG: hypothetical protein HKO93_05285 [Flavobacteriales bacterium]|nr:hypothetical protein [Flavobacteriales bacterium]
MQAQDDAEAYVSESPGVEYRVITIVESIVPMGIGRSRIIENQTDVNTEDATTERLDGKKSGQGKVKRKDLKVDEFSETKLLNFYSGVGINFQNIASNDALITAKMNEMSAAGWTLSHALSGVESNAGGDDGQGIYITRLIFTKKN